MRLELQAARFQLEATSDGLSVVVPGRRNGFIMLFLCAWLGGWFMGKVSAANKLFGSAGKTPTPLLAFWLVGRAVGGAFTFGIGRSRLFRTTDVKHLRAETNVSLPLSNQGTWFPPITASGFGPVAFDYEARTGSRFLEATQCPVCRCPR
jgi:hypothetical protein